MTNYGQSVKLINMKAFINIITYFFILLFTYAAVSKLLDFENFQVQITQSPLLSAYAGFISYAVIVLELVIVLLLIFPRSHLLGLYASTALMTAFTFYIFLILNYSDFVPCSCGGILEKMGWTEHLFLNILCVIIGIVAIYFTRILSTLNFRHVTSILLGTNLFSFGLVLTLFLTSEYIIKKENNFTRRFPQHVIIEDSSCDLKVNSYYFAGAVHDTIYLGNSTSPFLLTKIDKGLKKIKTTYLNPEKDLKFRNPKIAVTNKLFYLSDGFVPAIFTGSLHDSKGNAKIISYQYAYFDQLKPIDERRMVIRTQRNKDHKNILGILDMDPSENLMINEDALQKQKDGIFDTDGQLLMDYSGQNIYYFYYYQSKILKFDYSLKLLSEQKTINHSVSSLPEIRTLNNGTKKISTPSLPANQNMVVYQGIILCQSNLMGKFETASLWKKNNIIDVYNMNKNEYWGSFYLPNPNGDKVHQMLIHENYLYVLIGRKIVKYRIAQTLSNQFEQGKPKT